MKQTNFLENTFYYSPGLKHQEYIEQRKLNPYKSESFFTGRKQVEISQISDIPHPFKKVIFIYTILAVVLFISSTLLIFKR